MLDVTEVLYNSSRGQLSQGIGLYDSKPSLDCLRFPSILTSALAGADRGTMRKYLLAEWKISFSMPWFYHLLCHKETDVGTQSPFLGTLGWNSRRYFLPLAVSLWHQRARIEFDNVIDRLDFRMKNFPLCSPTGRTSWRYPTWRSYSWTATG